MKVESAHSSQSNEVYNEQLDIIESLYEFHPESFDELSPELREAIKTYYLLDEETPDNVFEYRLSLIEQNPVIEPKAKEAYNRLLHITSQSS